MTDNKGSSSLYGTNYFSFRRSRRTLIFGEADLSTSARLKWCFNELVRGYNRFMHSEPFLLPRPLERKEGHCNRTMARRTKGKL